MADHVVLRFDGVSFEYAHKKPLLDEVSFLYCSASRVYRVEWEEMIGGVIEKGKVSV